MGADLNNIVKFQRLSDEHVQFLIYQLLRGLKASTLHDAIVVSYGDKIRSTEVRFTVSSNSSVSFLTNSTFIQLDWSTE